MPLRLERITFFISSATGMLTHSCNFDALLLPLTFLQTFGFTSSLNTLGLMLFSLLLNPDFLTAHLFYSFMFSDFLIFNLTAEWDAYCHVISHGDDRNKINTILPLE